jgi:hypothetical protein
LIAFFLILPDFSIFYKVGPVTVLTFDLAYQSHSLFESRHPCFFNLIYFLQFVELQLDLTSQPAIILNVALLYYYFKDLKYEALLPIFLK